LISSKKSVTHEVVTIRVARGGEHAPLVIRLPKSLADAMKCEKGTKVHIYTDGERAYIEKLEEPKI
jgi:antitoxin component of MazEF toxin-antitoxin module